MALPPRESTMCRIPLTQGQWALVDAVDWEWASKMRWYANYSDGRCYAARNTYLGNGRATISLLHREIVGDLARGMEVHHKNDDSLDNRRENLAPLTHLQHQATKKWPDRGCTGYRGVTVFRQNRFAAKIRIRQKNVWCAYFRNPEDAARAYDKKALEIFGPETELNFPHEVAS